MKIDTTLRIASLVLHLLRWEKKSIELPSSVVVVVVVFAVAAVVDVDVVAGINFELLLGLLCQS